MVERKNILIVSTPFMQASENSVAGIEQMVYSLGKALHEGGNNVYTVATDDSRPYGSLVVGGFKDMVAFPGAELERFHQAMAYTTSQVRRFIRENQRLDIIIDRCQGVSLIASIEENGPPVISGLDMESKYYLHPLVFQTLIDSLRKRKDCFASVSNHIAEEYKRKLLPADLHNRMNVIYNGIISENFPLSETPENYLLYLGRIRKGKSPHLAIAAARATNHRIIVAGGSKNIDADSQYMDMDYFKREIKPLLDDSVEWFGPANLDEKVRLLQGAKALIFPSTHIEAFPLVPIESMMCGTPVIAFSYSKGPREIIVNGETGFTVENELQMAEAIMKIDLIDRRRCAEYARSRFDYRTMGKEYLELIERITR